MTLKRKINRSEIYQSFNLKRLLGYSPTERQKKAFYEMIVNKMVERTASGDDINGSKFENYTEEYADKKGVTVSAVDLIDEGDMLEGFQYGSSKDIVKLEVSSDQIDKAYGHISGMEGHPTIKEGKVRDFFGFKNEKDIEDVLKTVDRLGEDQGPRRTARAVDTLSDNNLKRAIREEIAISFFGLGDEEENN